MGARYSETFVEQALFKVYSRSERTVQSITNGLNVNCHTIRNLDGTENGGQNQCNDSEIKLIIELESVVKNTTAWRSTFYTSNDFLVCARVSMALLAALRSASIQFMALDTLTG